MSAHTPGLLRVLQNAKEEEKATQFLVVTDHGGRTMVLAKVARPGDADLFAAAPELLAALKDIADDYGDRFGLDSPSTNPGIKTVIENARAAIAKAEGRMP